MKSSRRDFLSNSILATAGLSTILNSKLSANSAESFSETSKKKSTGKISEPFSISIFSKNLQWLNYSEMTALAAQMGFDGIDLTVRPQGHVLPENVEKDLPKVMDAAVKAGVKIPMLATAITDANDPITEKILKTASSLGIKHYRTGWVQYDDTKSVEETIEKVKRSMSKLAELNEKYSISGEYQNHSGADSKGIYFGGSIWDLAEVLKSINSAWIGSQYDIYHANVEATNAWPVGFKLISPFIKSFDIKDFQWEKKDGKWITESVPLGEGNVDFPKYFKMLKENNLSGPISIHYEYPLGGANSGARELSVSRDVVISAMIKDLETLKKYLTVTL